MLSKEGVFLKGEKMKEYATAAMQRKSVRKYGEQKLSEEQLQLAKQKLLKLQPLIEDIEVEYEIVPAEQTNCKFNAEYCLLCYSQEKPRYRENVGYLLEQWDLYLQSIGIGVCWFGFGRSEKRKNGKIFVIMLSFGIRQENDFRTELGQFSRKQISEVWQGSFDERVAKLAQLSPSACNSQPWRVNQNANVVTVFRKKGGINPLDAVLSKHFNKLDLGIYLCFLEVALERFGYRFQRQIFEESKNKLEKVAEYVVVAE